MKFESSLNLNKVPNHRINHECDPVSATYSPGSPWVYYGVYYLSTCLTGSPWGSTTCHCLTGSPWGWSCSRGSTTCHCLTGSPWGWPCARGSTTCHCLTGSHEGGPVHEGLLPVAVWLVLHEGGPMHEGLGSVPDDVTHRLLRVNSKQINLIRRT